MATVVHVTATPLVGLGLVVLRVDVSGDLVPRVDLARRAVGDTTIDPVILAAGYLSVDGNLELVNGSAMVYDTTVPLDVPVEYLVAVPGEELVVVTGPVTVASGGLWRLGDPARPYLDITASLAAGVAECSTVGAIITMGMSGDSLDGRGETADVPGRRDPIVGTEVMSLPRFELRMATRTTADREAAEALLATGDVLLLRTPSAYAMGPRYVLVSEVQIDRLVNDHRKSWRRISAGLRQVGAPEVGAYGWLGTRWMDLCTGPYATWADLTAAGISWSTIGYGIAGGAFPAAMRTWFEVNATWASWAALTATGKTWAQLVEGA